ncbi:hypothetical protein HYC85_004445 [Camellia sinensis]|uniref:Uncharacterized protein n=1 Tax=Camellia sinensis TaxID=4442 RepID=A0A7J7HWK8_CAMSI|nr:hypothetical protein HYC85_004445 [Camellia sinensis]
MELGNLPLRSILANSSLSRIGGEERNKIRVVVVANHIYQGKSGKMREGIWYLAFQIVPLEPEAAKVLEGGEFWRNDAREVIVHKPQNSKPSEELLSTLDI